MHVDTLLAFTCHRLIVFISFFFLLNPYISNSVTVKSFKYKYFQIFYSREKKENCNFHVLM